MNLFRSARLKLTAFYFASLVAFCMLLTFGVRIVTNYELNRGDDARRGAFHKFIQNYSDDNNLPYTIVTPGDRSFSTTQARQDDMLRERLARDFLLIDIGLLAIGAVISYWYAGRTLKPIEEAHERQKQFTSDASHELRTPLTNMKLENEIFLRQKQFSETDARELIASNLEEVERLEKLAGNLLSLNRYENGEAVSHAPVNITELAAEAVARTQRNKLAHKIVFAENLEPAKVDVNRESIIELLVILLDNAIKYGPREGDVEITGSLEGEQYILTVHDHGPGIPEEDLPHIFERMYRGDKARSSKVSGHGIGLSLARQIAEANEATLIADNHPEGGAQFVLTLS